LLNREAHNTGQHDDYPSDNRNFFPGFHYFS
jgi:hypothetical protein